MPDGPTEDATVTEGITATVTEDITATVTEDIIVTATVTDEVDDLAICEAGLLVVGNDDRLSTLPASLCRSQRQPGEVCLPGRLGPAVTLLWR